MLQKLSDGAKGGISKFILVGFLFMAVAGLVLTDVGGFFRDGVSSTSVADVGNQSVPYHEFDRFARNMLSRQGISVQDAYQVGQVNELLRRYTQDILFVQNAHKFGVRIPDSEIAEQLHKFIEPYKESGEESPQEAFNQFLAQQGLSEADFVTALRRDMTTNIIQNALSSGVTTTPSALSNALLRYQNETRTVSYVTLPHDQIVLETAPSEDELSEFYELSKAEYKIPERRGFSIAILNPETLSKDIVISNEAVLEVYESDKERYRVPAGRKIEQAIFSEKADAEAILETVQNGSPLEDVAGDNYRGEQLIDRENAPPALSEVLFAEDDSSLRGPVQSPLGWHVINILGDTEAAYKSFEAVKASIVSVLKTEAENERIFETIDLINDKIDEGIPLNEISDEYAMERLTLEPIDQFSLNADNKDGLTSFENDKALLTETLFNLYEDEVSEMIELSDGRFAIMNVETIEPESFKSFDSVKAQILERLIQTRRRTENQLKAQEALKQLTTDESNLENIGTVATASITRSQNTFEDANISMDLKTRIFGNDPDSYVMTQNADGFILAKSSAPQLSAADELKDDITKQTFEQLEAVQILSTYFAHLEQETPVKVNNQLLDQLYGQPRN